MTASRSDHHCDVQDRGDEFSKKIEGIRVSFEPLEPWQASVEGSPRLCLLPHVKSSGSADSLTHIKTSA